MSYEKVISKSKKIESMLVETGAEGKGLHEKASSIEYKLSANTLKKIRFIASIRNQLLHDDSFELTQELLEGFENASVEVIEELRSLNNRSQSTESSSSSSSSSIFEEFYNASTLKKAGMIALGAAALFGILNS